MLPKPIIVDISEWQVPSQINYDQLSEQIAGVIVRIQYGSNYEDKHYRTHIQEFQKRQIPIAVYAWVRGTSVTDMEQEAIDFYRRGQVFQPTFWWLDVEEQSMGDMRVGVEAYRKKLKRLGARKVGAYIANHLYHSFSLEVSHFDALWLPTYGRNTGVYNGSNPTATKDYDLHQYTDKGKLSGYPGYLDLNRIARGKLNDYFNQTVTVEKQEEQVQRFKLLFDVYLRQGPSKKSKSLALLNQGEEIWIQKFEINEGYLWGEQKRDDQTVAYLALGMLQEYVEEVK